MPLESTETWVRLGRWGEPFTHLTMRKRGGIFRFECGQCGTGMSQSAETCETESVVGMGIEFGCGARFTSITTPHDRLRDDCLRLRPDLEYISVRWG